MGPLSLHPLSYSFPVPESEDAVLTIQPVYPVYPCMQHRPIPSVRSGPYHILHSRVISPGSYDYLPSYFIIEEFPPEIFLAQCVGHKLIVRALHVRLLLEYLLHDIWRQLQGDLQVSTSFLPRDNVMEIPSGWDLTAC